MPEISRFLGIVIYIYPDDHNPPHFHVRYNSHKALIQIQPVGLLQGNLPPRVLALVVEWASIHQSEILKDWELVSTHQLPNPIAPLE